MGGEGLVGDRCGYSAEVGRALDCSAVARRAATASQSRKRPLSSFEKEARRLRSSSVSPGWHRSKSSRINDSR